MGRKLNVLTMLGWYDHRILMGIARYARQADWHLPSRHLYDGVAPPAWNGDGLLVMHGPKLGFDAFVRRQSKRHPTVLIGGDTVGVTVPQVSEDNVMIGQLAARHFLERGYRNFAWFSPVAGARVPTDRLGGFRQTLVQGGLDCALLQPSKAVSRDGRPGRTNWNWLAGQLQALPKPLALFVLDDQVAAEVIEVCLEFQLPVPQSVAVVGVGNLTFACECSLVPISSVEIDFEEMGYRAAAMLDGLMASSGAASGAAPESLLLRPLGVVARRSTDVQAGMHPKVLEAVQFIRDHFKSRLQVSDIADNVAMSQRRLSYLFASELRGSPAAYLMDVRLERAKTLLRETDLKLRQIAELSGIDSERNLRRALRRQTGISPLAFRQKHRVIKVEA